MKKILYFAALAMMFAGSSCSKDEVGGTSTEALAGEWFVTIDAVDDNGNPIDGGEDYFGIGEASRLLTYNTAANNATMWVDDLGAFTVAELYNYPLYPNYAIRCKVNVDAANLTFSSVAAANEADAVVWYDDDGNEAYRVDPLPSITIEDGKILPGAATQNNGSPCDSIVFYVKYTDDPWYPDDGYAKYRVSGKRYSGLVENEW